MLHSSGKSSIHYSLLLREKGGTRCALCLATEFRQETRKMDWLFNRMDDGSLNKAYQDTIIVLSLCLLKTLLAVLVLSCGFRMIIQDEPIRWQITNWWVASPFFAPGDHIWLGGYFYLYGIATMVLGNSYAVAKMLPLCFSLGSILGIYALCQVLYGNRLLSFCATFLYTVGSVHTWASISAMPEIFVIFFQTWGMFFLIKGIRSKRLWMLALGCLGVAFTTSFRYEMWFLALAVDVLLVVLVIRRSITFGALLLLVLLTNFYVWAWMLTAWIWHGDPLLFLHAAKEINIQVPGNPVLFLWNEIRMTDPTVFVLGCAGMLVGFFFPREKGLRFYAVIVFLFTISFVYLQKIGTCSTVWRIIQGWRGLFVPLIPALFLLVQNFDARWGKRLTLLVLVLLLPVYFFQQTAASRKIWMLGHNNATWAVGEYLLFERNHPTMLKISGKENPSILFVGEGLDWMECYDISFISGLPVRFEHHLAFNADFVITRNRELPAPYQVAHQIGEWYIWSRVSSVAGN
jgi:hypothetical protein